MRWFRLPGLLFFVISLWAFSPADASDIAINGFLQGNYSVNSGSANPNGGDFKWAEETFQTKLEASKDRFHLFIKADAFLDHMDEDGDFELREGYADFTASKWDVRLGRQIITWGLGDLVFINDVFPKDYEAFFSGRPLEYLKKGVDGIRLSLYPAFASFEILAIPFFEPNHFPSPARFHVFDPLPGITNREEMEPASKPENTEVALRAYRDLAGFDLSIYFYRGFFRQPSAIPDDPITPSKLTLQYPRLSVYGASLQGNALDGVLSLEAGYYDSRRNRDGSNPLLPNSHTRFLIGYQRQVSEDFTAGVQYYAEYLHDYDEYQENLPAGFPRQNRLSDFLTVRLTRFLRHQTLRLSFFSFVSTSDHDYLLNPEIK